MAQLAGAVEYTNCISAEGYDSLNKRPRWASWLRLLNTLTASLQRGKNPFNKCPGYDVKPSDGEAPALEVWGVWSSSSLPLLPVPL